MGIFDKVRSVTQQVTGKLDVAKNRREIEKHEQELREDPENIFSLQELSTRYQEVGEDEKAVDLLCRLAEIYKRQFNFDLAFASYRKAERISVSTQRLKVLHSLIALYVQAKRYEESYPYVKQAVEGFLEANQPDAAQAVLDLVPTFGYKEKLYRGELSSLIIIYRSTEPIPSNLTTGPLLPTGPQTGSLPSSNPYTGSLSSSSRPTGHLPASVSLPQPPISQPTSPLPPSSTNWGTGPLTPSSPFQSPMSPTSGPLTPSSPFQPPLANRGTGPLTSSGYSAPLPMSRPTGQFLPKESVTPSQPTGSWTGKHRKLSLEDTETFPNDTLLIVDDEPHTLHLLQMMFRPLGCRILTAANGIEALTCALEHQPTLIISDLLMPHMDGSELFAKLREHPTLSQVPFVCMSSRGDESERAAALETGVEEYWVKPLSTQETIIRTRRLLKRPRPTADMSGKLSTIPIGQLLNLLNQERKTGLLTVRTSTESSQARIYLQNGEIVDAELGDLRGKLVLFKLIYCLTGEFVFYGTSVNRPNMIGLPTHDLLIEAMRRFDQSLQLLKSFPDSSLVYTWGQDIEDLFTISEEEGFTANINRIMTLFDGRRTIGECLSTLTGDLETLTLIHSLIEEKMLIPTSR